MKGGKQLRKIYIGDIRVFDTRHIDTLLNEYHVQPENIISVCIYKGGTWLFYLSEN